MTPSLSDSNSSSSTNGHAPSQADGETFWYGAGALQFATLFRARSPEVLGVVVILHGGYWRSEWGSAKDTTPIALDLAGRGYTRGTSNIAAWTPAEDGPIPSPTSPPG
jgi:hypothetical protein